MKKFFVFALAIMATMFAACSDDKDDQQFYYSWTVGYGQNSIQTDNHSYGILKEWSEKVEKVTAPYCGFGTFTSDNEPKAKADLLEEQLVKLEEDFLKAQEEMDFGSGNFYKEFFTIFTKEKSQLKTYANHAFKYESPVRLYARKVYAPANFATTLEQDGVITAEEHYNLDDLNLKDEVEFSIAGEAKIYNTKDHLIYKGAKFIDVKAVGKKELVITYTFNKNSIKDYQSAWNILVPVKVDNAVDMKNCLSLNIDLTK